MTGLGISMRKQAGPYAPLLYSLLGGLAGGAAALKSKSIHPALGLGGGTLLGAGLGSGLNALTYKRPEKHDRIEPGFYYGSRNIYADNPIKQDIPLIGSGLQHSFLFGVFDKKPKKLPTIKLPNGQYATTFSGWKSPSQSKKNQDIPELCISILDKPNVDRTKFKLKNDIVTLRKYLNPDSVKNWDSDLKPTLLAKGEAAAKDLSRRAASIIAQWDNKRLGDYRIFSAGKSYGNCNTVAASLMDSLNIPENVRPWRVGGIGGVQRSAMSKYRNLINRTISNESSTK